LQKKQKKDFKKMYLPKKMVAVQQKKKKNY